MNLGERLRRLDDKAVGPRTKGAAVPLGELCRELLRPPTLWLLLPTIAVAVAAVVVLPLFGPPLAVLALYPALLMAKRRVQEREHPRG